MKISFNLSDIELGWIAGILEGEGCFDLNIARRKIIVTCGLTDEDVVKKLQSLLGGTIYVRPKSRDAKATKDYYVWNLRTREIVIPFLHLIQPLMGNRRQKKIDDMLIFNMKYPKILLKRDLHGRYQNENRETN